MSADTFYSSLDRSRKQIRLLSFDVAGELSVSTFDEPWPQYTALSYTWGPSGDEVAILINGRPYHARSNLCTFLEALKSCVLNNGRCTEDLGLRLGPRAKQTP